VTSDLAVALMRGQLQFLQQQGFDVTLISSPGKWLDTVGQTEHVRIIGVPMEREIAPLKDFVSLCRLWWIMRTLHPDISNVGTPKAGLLAGCAAWFAGVPYRFYTLRGLRFETASGPSRRLLVFAERMACRLAHRVICVSESLRDRAIASGLTTRQRTVVFGSGSSNGVDASRYVPTPDVLRRAAELRCKLSIPASAPIVGFVGRLTNDKGVPELVEGFSRLDRKFPDLRLLLLGPFEGKDTLSLKMRKRLETHPRIILTGRVADTAAYYALMDVLVLPSHREGFPNVVLEAYAAGKPVVAARATGIVDAVMDGETGLLFAVGDVAALVGCLQRLLGNKVMASKLAAAGQELVKREFRQDMVWNALNEEYRRLLKTRAPLQPVLSVSEQRSDFAKTND
jgi:glycosyltransferase involved in cell wall biosynthesis